MRPALQRMLDENARFTPRTGYHVVGRDDFEEPGAMLYVVAWCATREQADAVVADRRATEPDEVLYVYESAP